MTDLEMLSARIQNVEASLKRARRLTFIACICTAAAIMLGNAFSQGKGPDTLDQLDPLQTLQRGPAAVQAAVQPEVRARKFILVDSNDKERATLVSGNDGSVYLVMFDAAGKNRVNLAATPAGPSLTLYDPSGQARTAIGSTALIGSRLAGERTPASSIVLFDKDGKLIARQ